MMDLGGSTKSNVGRRVLFFSCCLLWTGTAAFLCDHLPGRGDFDSLKEAVANSQGFLILCPFEIRDDGCSETGLGLLVKPNSEMTILCQKDALIPRGWFPEKNVGEDEGIAGCVINCPHNHFAIATNGTLFLDGMTLSGSTTSAVYIEPGGRLEAYESTFHSNHNPSGNGGAIHASERATLLAHQCDLINNTALNGGAIYSEGGSQIVDCNFVDNKSTSTTSMAGGGAITIGVFATASISNSYFFGNEAANILGAAIVDHSNGRDTVIQGNVGCLNLSPSARSCNGVEQSASASDTRCREFESSCLAAAQEHSSEAEHESTTTASEPTHAPSIALPTNFPSETPSSMPATPFPTIDPCIEDIESFDCMLHELLFEYDAEEVTP